MSGIVGEPDLKDSKKELDFWKTTRIFSFENRCLDWADIQLSHSSYCCPEAYGQSQLHSEKEEGDRENSCFFLSPRFPLIPQNGPASRNISIVRDSEAVPCGNVGVRGLH